MFYLWLVTLGKGRWLTFQSSSFHQLGLFRRESRYEMFRKRVMLGVLAEALMKCMAASRSTANVCAVAKAQSDLLPVYNGCLCPRGTYPLGASPPPCAGAPEDIVGLDLVEDALGLRLALDLLDAADQDVELALEALAELLDGGDLLLGADDAGDGPRLLEQDWGQQLADLAVAAEDEDVLAHGDVVVVSSVKAICRASCSCWFVVLVVVMLSLGVNYRGVDGARERGRLLCQSSGLPTRARCCDDDAISWADILAGFSFYDDPLIPLLSRPVRAAQDHHA